MASPCVAYLNTCARQSRASVLRFVLEQYAPYKAFKARLNVTTGVVSEAATQIRAIYSISAHRDVIAVTFVDLGTYANSLASQGAGLYLAVVGDEPQYLSVLNEVVQDREAAEMAVRRRMGFDVAAWIDQGDVLSHLVTAYQRLPNVDEDTRAPIVHAANGFESFLTQVAVHHGVDLAGATGINSKADRLAREGKIATKHKFMCKYLGHVRNATEHGADPETNHVWDVSPTTAVEYVHVAQSVIAAVVSRINGRYVV
ncbi:hypothetical protein ACFL09_03540 [Planctomycetota bacterium]